MATLYIGEFQVLGGQYDKLVPAVEQPPITEQTVAIGAASAKSAAFQPNTRIIRVHCDTSCSISIGPAAPGPVATTSNGRMAANTTEYFVVKAGQVLAVIQN